MTGQWKRLFKIEILQKYGFNEARYSKDKAKKRRLILIGFCYLLVAVMLVAYVSLGAFGLCAVGASEILMPYLFAITSVIIFFFSVFRAGSVIFQMQTYELLISLPVSVSDIVISRFLSMYISDVVISAMVMLPGSIIYSIYATSGLIYWLMVLISIILLPLFPILTATIIGTIVTAIGARMKYRNFVTVVVSMLFIIGVLIVSFIPSYLSGSGQFNEESLVNITDLLREQVNHMYLFAPLFTKAMTERNLIAFLGLIVIYIGGFALFLWAIQKYFPAICNLLLSRQKKGNYKVGSLKTSSPSKALYIKEWKRYFSSNAYVMNTAVGYIMMLLFSGAFVFVGSEKMEQMVQIPGGISLFAPLLLAFMVSIAPITANSISMEGKNWWLPMSLPVSYKQIMDSKILVNLTLSIPSCLISSFLLCFGMKASGMNIIWVFITPVVYSVFTAVSGIFINLKFPQFNWKNEMSVVKQSGASFMAIIQGFVIVGVPIALLIFQVLDSQIIMLLVNLVLSFLTISIYLILQKHDLRKLGA